MAVSRRVIEVILLLEIFQLAVGFVRLDTTPTPPESSSRGFLQNVSLRHLTPKYLTHFSSDITYLKISGSKIDVIQKNAFDHLTHLNLLEISDCEFRQEIDPQTFSRLPGLETLELKHVGLRRVNLNLTNVQDLVLEENEIETFDPRTVFGRNIKFLDLSKNKLKFLEGSFTNMSKLTAINLIGNKISKVPPVFEENSKLLRIFASENKITSTEGLKLSWLKILDLFRNEIQLLDSESFPRMTFLEILNLSFNRIHKIEDAFKDLFELKELYLSWNNIEKLNPGLFRNNLYLTKLDVQGNRISSLEKFQNVHPHLTHLVISFNLVSKIDEDFFLSTPALEVLDLSYNQLKTLPGNLGTLTELKALNLAFNNVVMSANQTSNEGMKDLRNNSQLNFLDLSNNQISDFCDGSVAFKNLLKLNLKGNKIKNLNCLIELKSLCEVDLRDNPLPCGEDFDGLILNLAKRKAAPYKLMTEFQPEPLYNQCENLSLNRSVNLWNSIQREFCPNGEPVEVETSNEWGSTEEETLEEATAESLEIGVSPEEKPHEKHFLVTPIGWIKNDEMNKPNPLQNPQSGRLSWGSIDENSELLNGFEDEEMEKRPRFSWYTIALILIGLSLTLTCFNLVVFFYIKLKVWKRADANSPQKYTALHNEVYKNTTEPSKASPGEEWVPDNEIRNKMFTYGKINEILLNFGLNKKDKDSESAKNILINSTNGSQNF